MTDTHTNTDNTDTLRPFSTSSIISPHAALESLTKDMYPTLDVGSMGEEEQDHERTTPSSASSSRNPTSSTSDPTARTQVQVNGAGSEPSPTSPRYIVRAQFDFDASDPSALSFKSGDVIEVFTMLESGWWDGMLDGRRGWFPSNFVEELQLDDEVEEGPESSDQDHRGQGHDQDEHTHGLGLVGDQIDRERDMALLDTEEFGVPSRHRRDMSSGSTSALGIDDAGWGSGGLDDLAREMMDSNLDDREEEEDEGKAFQAEAMRRRRLRDSDDVDDFGTLRTPYSRRREETDDTIRQNRNGSGAQAGQSGNRGKARESVLQDAWIPSLTPEGQVRLVIYVKD